MTWADYCQLSRRPYHTPDSVTPKRRDHLVYHISCQLIEAEWHKYAWVNIAIISPDNALAFFRCQTYVWTNDSLILKGSFRWNLN